MSDAESRPAGWYPDAEMTETVRYWDGASWTEHRAPAGGDDRGAPPTSEPGSAAANEAPKQGAGNTGRGCLVLVAIVVGLVVLSSFFGDDDGDDGGGEIGARIACEDFVKDRLKSPGTADFSDTTTTAKGSDAYVVEGAVDSENGFGALIRNTYACEVRYSAGDETWRLVDLQSSEN